MPSKIRMQRISERIRNELSSMLLMEVQDPRVSGISITDVKVDRELAYADVYVSAVEGSERSKEVLEGLYSAQGFLRRALSDRVELRSFPRLRFHWDPTPERADQIERVLADLRESDPSLSETGDVEAEEAEVDASEADKAALNDFSVAEDLAAADDLPEEADFAENDDDD